MPALILRLLALLTTIAAPLVKWTKAFWNKIWGSATGTFLANQVAEASIKAVARAAIVVMLMAAYGVFLGVFWTYVTGTSLREIFNSQPFSGCPAGVLYLVSHAFPIKFMVGTMFAYIQWRFTMILAGIIFSRAVRAMAGA